MKILSINSSYTIKGGADRFFWESNQAFSEAGHTVVTYTPNNKVNNNQNEYKNIKNCFSPKLPKNRLLKILESILRIYHSPKFCRDLKNVIANEKPDLVVLHNFYHRMPYSMLKTINHFNIPSYFWLHDYKWICPNHMLYKKGKNCNLCTKGNFIHALKYRCQNNSFFQSLIATTLAFFLKINNYDKYVSAFIAPSNFVKETFLKSSLKNKNIIHIPHFSYVNDNKVSNLQIKTLPNKFALYVGRIEENKGIFEAVKQFGTNKLNLVILGTGHKFEALKNYVFTNKFETVKIIGLVTPTETFEYYKKSKFVIVPSLWNEVFGLSILEAFHFSKPVIGYDKRCHY